MKKLMIAASAALCAAVGLAVESSNIVGYAPTDNQGAEAPIIGGQFFAVNGGTTFDLKAFSIPGSKEWDGDCWDCQYMNPGTEYIRVLNTSSLANAALYTYISEEYILDNVQDGDLTEEPNPDLSEYAWAIGWWRRPLTGVIPKYIEIIESGETSSEYRVTTADNISLKAGYGVIGTFANGKVRSVNFPSAISVPSKQ